MRALRFASVGLSLVAATTIYGCSSDSEPLPAGGGGNQVVTGGTTGAGGSVGKGGASGTTGKGGSGATGGAATAGTGGSTTAGTGGASAGTGGAAGGKAGSAGSAGGKAGSAGASAGSAGATAGSAGSAGAVGGAAGAAGTSSVGGAAGAGAGGGGGIGGNGGNGGNAGMFSSAGGSGGFGGGVTGTPDDKAAILAMLSNPCTDALSTIYDDAAPFAIWDPSHRGEVVRCAYDRLIPKSEMTAHFAKTMFADPGIYTDVHKFRITYWTERDATVPMIGSAGAGGASLVPSGVITSATLYVPAIRVAKPAPLVVFAHPTVGSADVCAPSKDDPMGFHQDWRSKAYGLVGHGWTVVMPDMPGLGTSGQPAWDDSEDEAHALLDATRAVRKIATPSLVTSKNAFVGHSEGGHGVLAVQSYASTYGADGTVDALVAFAPVSFSQGAWGAELAPVAAAMKLYLPSVLGFATQYIYGHLAKYEGDAHRTDAFQPAVAAQLDTIMQTHCEGDVGDALYAVGSNMKATDLYTSAYTGEVGSCGAFGMCAGATASWWHDRWAADRPLADKSLPIVIWQGALDLSVSPDRQQCGVDRLAAQGAPVTTCGDVNADHSSIAASIFAGSWSEQYLYAQLLGGTPPSACPAMVRADGSKPVCPPLPKNGLLPTDP